MTWSGDNALAEALDHRRRIGATDGHPEDVDLEVDGVAEPRRQAVDRPDAVEHAHLHVVVVVAEAEPLRGHDLSSGGESVGERVGRLDASRSHDPTP